ncbi:MAG TPA: sigma-70 family RNA polymerase sigma factor [Ktedonobacterales bacterium]|jgi:RNA polymerase sigma-70 factor (ECF subfamily)
MDPRTLLGRLGIPGDGARELGGLATSLGAAIPVAGLAGAPAAKAAPALELDLIARARGGDQDAFAVLVRLHQRAVYALAMRMLRDEDEATEATQEAFLAAWQGLAGFRAEARFATWVYRITYNYCLKVAERRRRDALARAELTSQTERAERPAVRLSQVHAQAALRDLCDTVRAEMANLPPKYRAVLALRHLQDLTYEEMADVLGMPIGTVKTHLFRARALLRDRLGDLDRATSSAASSGMTRAGELSAGLSAGLRDLGDMIGKGLDGWRKEAER